ncbi:uncharacterized protein PGTG_17405 [Puccinia graminis f. sp. tritici CRL 75-36-700-3]|uniref:Uncharacterized protein n=1 Tax=Puccinia graminis f. sp. tritici (strain CRL 75-36-700-3 / race SCCL) TaxID=418459 RepID=E3L6C5_PUCGT|nr:uncharacterized protein PGTG_17405 [Puccinia graminis f. sp. tritici CRL 75-36-700-3]EFP92100.2 hypothetical protein PGTG_17405 [Puccinia graminis f. sp. tritici CRL 75-36-700-3]
MSVSVCRSRKTPLLALRSDQHTTTSTAWADSTVQGPCIALRRAPWYVGWAPEAPELMAGVPQAKKTRPSCYLQIGCANYGGESGYGLFPSEYPARAGQELWPVLVASSCGQFLSGDGVEKQLGRGTDLSRANEHFSASLAANQVGAPS